MKFKLSQGIVTTEWVNVLDSCLFTDRELFEQYAIDYIDSGGFDADKTILVQTDEGLVLEINTQAHRNRIVELKVEFEGLLSRRLVIEDRMDEIDNELDELEKYTI